MFTRFGYFNLPIVLLIALAVMFLLFLVRGQARSFIRSVFLFFSSLMTSLRGHTAAQSSRAKRRYEELRDIFLEENSMSQTLRHLQLREEVNAKLAADASINRFRLEEVVQDAETLLNNFREYPTGLFDTSDLDEANSKQVAAVKTKAIKTWEKTNSTVKDLARLFRNLKELASKDAARIDQIKETTLGLDQKLSAMQEATEGAARPPLQRRSIMVPFLLSAVFVAGAAIGVFSNAQLLYLPLTELMGDGEAIRGIKTALAGAVAFIILEIIAGAIALEGFSVTDWGIFESSGRIGKIVGAFALFCLLVLAGAEAALVESREAIVENQTVLEDALSIAADETSIQVASVEKLSRVGQVAFAFIIPFVLALAAMPLRTFLRTARIIAQFTWFHLLGLIAIVAGAVRRLAHALENIIQRLFVLVIAIPHSIVQFVELLFSMTGISKRSRSEGSATQ